MTQAQIAVPRRQVADLCQRYQVRRLALFGSVLCADFRPDSDVDVLVDFAPQAQVGFITLARLQRELADLLGRPVDLVPRTGLKPVIRDQVLASAEEIYAARKTLSDRYSRGCGCHRTVSKRHGQRFAVDWSIVWVAATQDAPKLRSDVEMILDAEFIKTDDAMTEND